MYSLRVFLMRKHQREMQDFSFSWIKLKLEIDDGLCGRTTLELFGSDKRNANFGAF